MTMRTRDDWTSIGSVLCCLTVMIAGLLLFVLITASRAGDDADDDVVDIRFVRLRVKGTPQVIEAEATLRYRLELKLQMEIEYLGRQIELSEGQRTALRLAGRGDIKHHLDEVAVLRRELEEEAVDGVVPARVARDIEYRYYLACAKVREGFFGRGSLYDKMMKRRLDRATLEKLARAEWVKLSDSVTWHFAGVLKLSGDQAEKLRRLVADRVPPPTGRIHSAYAYWLTQVAELPKASLQEILNPEQIKRLDAELADGKKLVPELTDELSP